MTIQRILRRLMPALLLCAVASGAVAQPGVWTLTPTEPPSEPTLMAAHFIDGTTGMVAGLDGSTGVMYRTTNAGTTWTSVWLPGSPGSINDILFISGNQRGFITGDNNYFAITVDGGATWTQRSLPAGLWSSPSDLNAVAFLDASRGWVVGNVAGGNGPRMAATTNGGLNWSVVPMTGPANNLYDIELFDFLHGLTVGTGNPTRKSASSNSGLTWEADANMGATLQTESVSMYGLDAIDGTPIAFAVGGKNYASPRYPMIRRTTDYGVTWSNLVSTSIAGLQGPAHDVIALGPSVIYVSGHDASIVRSVDSGRTWTAETMPAGLSATIDLTKFSFTPDNYLWVVGTSGTVMRTRLVPDARFVPSPRIPFGIFCPGGTGRQTLSIGNTGLGVLNVAGASIIQPNGGTIQFSLVLPAIARVWPRQTAEQRIDIVVGAGTPGGTHIGEIRLSTNDENGTGTDAFTTIQLIVEVHDNGIGIDSTISRDAGPVRIGARRTMPMAGFLRNVSTVCLAPVDTAYLVHGLDFRLIAPFVGSDTLRPSERRDIQIEFSPSRLCERYDTLVVEQSGGAVKFRVPITGTGVEPTYATVPTDTLRFGSVQIGGTGAATLSLVNRKAGSCLDRTALRSLRIGGPNAAEFSTSVSFTPGSSFIPPDSSLAVPFVAAPTAMGRRIAWAIITHELSAVSDTVVLLVNGTDVELTTSTDEIVFAITGVGMRRDTTIADALRNLGASAVTIATATITGVDAGAFVLSSPVAPRTISTGASDSIVLSFMPNRAGMFNATLELRSDRGTLYTFRLAGEAADAAGALGRDPIVFAATPMSSCLDELIERFIVNTGRVPLIVRGLGVVAHPRGAVGDAARFSGLAPAFPPEISIVPGDSLRVTLRFCPNHLGEHVASLAVETNIPGPSLLDTLIGEGIRARIAAADSIAFAATRLGTGRDSTFDPFLINLGISPLDITAVTLVGGDTGDFSIDLPTPPLSVAAGGTMPATVSFTPRARGVRSTTLRIESSQGTQDVIVSGRGIYPLIVVTGPTNPRERVGRSLAITYTIENRGDDTGRVEWATIAGSPAFVMTSTSLPTTLEPTRSATVTMSFTPPAPCEHATVLTVGGEGVTELVSVGDTSIAITGIGTSARLDAMSDTVDFGTILVDAMRDSVLDGFVANRFADDPSLVCADSVAIDAITIGGADAASFELIAPVDPRAMIEPGALLAMTVRFHPTRTGPHVAELAIAYDGASDSVLKIELIGNADALPLIAVGLSFGADHVTKPGDVIRVPLTLAGDIAAAAFDTLVAHVAYHRSLLRFERVIAVGAIVASNEAPVFGSQNAQTTVTLSSPMGIPSGTIAELEFRVLLGSVLDADVFADSITVPQRPEVIVVGDSANVSIAEFCDANGRLISFGGALAVKVSPNPAGDELTLAYNLPADGRARLALYDAAGSTVLTIVDDVLGHGAYIVSLDMRALPAGTYFLRLTAGRFEDAAVIRLEK